MRVPTVKGVTTGGWGNELLCRFLYLTSVLVVLSFIIQPLARANDLQSVPEATASPSLLSDPGTQAESCPLAFSGFIDSLKSLDGNEAQKAQREDEITANSRAEEQLQSQTESAVRQSTLEENWIFNELLSQLTSGKATTQIARWLDSYIEPVVKQAEIILTEAKAAHEIIRTGNGASVQQSEAFQQIYSRYQDASKAYGEKIAKAQLIFDTLRSIAEGHGALYITMSRLDTSNPKIANEGKLTVYNLTSKQAQAQANEVLKALDRDEFVRSGLIQKEAVQTDGATIPYPTLYLALHTVLENDSIARVAKSRWDLEEQKITSSKRLWFAQLLAQISSTVYSNPHVWSWLRSISMAISGPLDVWTKSVLYNAKIYDLMTNTLKLDDEGNIVISTSDYLVDLQIDKLNQILASSYLDESQLFEALVQSVGSRRVLDALIQALAKRAGLHGPPPFRGQDTQLDSDNDKAPKHENLQDFNIGTGAVTVQINGVDHVSAQILYNGIVAAALRKQKNNLQRIPWNKPAGWKVAFNVMFRHLVALGTTAPVTYYGLVQLFNYATILAHHL